jgi:uncharacterized membrane-anchored protein
MKKQYIGLMIVVSIILVVVFSFILYNQWPLMTGDKIVLATQPVDPFDPFRGQYMTINYEISRISDVEGFEEGNPIYISLKEDEQGIWRKDDVSKSKPQRGDFIKGEVISIHGNSVRIEYGIEQFFFERHAQLPTRNITVEVSVASSGRAKLSQMLHNGEPIEIEYEKFDIKS